MAVAGPRGGLAWALRGGKGRAAATALRAGKPSGPRSSRTEGAPAGPLFTVCRSPTRGGRKDTRVGWCVFTLGPVQIGPGRGRGAAGSCRGGVPADTRPPAAAALPRNLPSPQPSGPLCCPAHGINKTQASGK